jgi:glycosyltransferase involved in cell wall biosynthesis
MFLLEAAWAGKPVVSFQPGLKGPDGFIGNRLGLTRPVYEPAALEEALREALARPVARPSVRRDQWFDGRAAERVERLLLDVVRRASGAPAGSGR